MTVTAHVLRISDRITENAFSPAIRDFEIVIDQCDEETPKDTCKEVLEQLGSIGGYAGLRLKVGTNPQSNISGFAWADEPFGFLTYQGYALLRSLTVERDGDGAGETYRVKGTVSGFGPKHDDDTLPIRLTAEASGRAAQGWRSEPIIPTEQIVSGDFDGARWDTAAGGLNVVGAGSDETGRPAGDIGGNKVDFGGQPISLIVPQVRITIDVVRRLPYWKWDQSVGLDLNPGSGTNGLCLSGFDDVIGCRNANTFLGFGMGELKWESTVATPLDNEYSTIRMVWLYDEWKHAIQIPRPTYFTSTGAMTADGDPRDIKHMIGVYWSQPHLRAFEVDPDPATSFFYPGELDYMAKIAGNCGTVWPPP